MSQILDWLSSLPPTALYVTLALAATIENIFPPVPADTVVAFGSFLAARGNGTIIGAFLSTWVGNLAGAATMYAAGRRYGAERIERRLLGNEAGSADSRLRAMYEKYGLAALFFSRFIPGLRALVPPFAGALRLSPVSSLVVMGVASGIWYGVISVVAFRVGSDFEAMQRVISHYGKVAAAVAVVIILAGAGIWWVRRKKQSTE